MNKKKLITIGILSVIILLIFKTCNSDKDAESNSVNNSSPANERQEINYDSINNVALEVIKKEPKVKDATITDANVLYVAVIDDGTNRKGYAEYCCQVLKELNSNVDWVKVVEFGSHNSPNKDNAYGILLGESRCDFK